MAFLAKIFVSIVIFVITISVVSGQFSVTGLCPQNLTIQQDFNLDDYMGNWFEYERFSINGTVGLKCIYATYTKKDADTVEVVYSGVSFITGKAFKVTGEAKIIKSGELSLYFRGDSKASTTTPNYIVLATDYTNYAVVYTCEQFTRFMNMKIVWILTRERFPPTDVIEEAHRVLDDNNLSKNTLRRIDQNNCRDKEMDLPSLSIYF